MYFLMLGPNAPSAHIQIGPPKPVSRFTIDPYPWSVKGVETLHTAQKVFRAPWNSWHFLKRQELMALEERLFGDGDARVRAGTKCAYQGMLLGFGRPLDYLHSGASKQFHVSNSPYLYG